MMIRDTSLTGGTRRAAAAAFTGLVYYGLARLGLLLVLDGTNSSPVWPAAGFALASARLFGVPAVWGVFLGSCLANLQLLAGRADPAGLALAITMAAAGSAAQAAAGARLLERTLPAADPLERVRDVATFVCLAPMVCLIAATAGPLGLAASGLLPWERFGGAWLTWWVGDCAGSLLVAPLLLAWSSRESAPSHRAAAEAATVLVLTAACALAVFGSPNAGPPRPPLSYLLFPFLIWSGLRLDARATTAIVATFAGIVLWQTSLGHGPFGAGRAAPFFHSSLYLVTAALTAYFLRASSRERETARALLERAGEALEHRVSEQSNHLWNADVALRVAAIGRKEDEKRVLLYRRIVDELPAGIVVLNLERPGDPRSLRVVEMNPAGQRLAGAEGEPAEGRTLLDFAPEVFDTDLPHACLRSLRTGREEVLHDYISRDRVPGAHFSIKIFPLDERQVGLVFENVTAELAARAALARSNAELTQFAYVASHDLQEPLRKAEAFAEQFDLRMAGKMDETSRDFLMRLRRSLDGMQDLIEALLQLARVTTQNGTPREVDLSMVAADAVEDLAVAIERSGGSVSVSALPRVEADARQMRQLLQNLISNAVKFHRPDAPPTVRVHGRDLDDGTCEVCVEDDGAGFDMQYAGRLFQPFSRLHSRNDFPGTGMGLAICQKIVEKHGGKITATSVPGRGSRFCFVLPSARSGAGARPGAEGALN